MIIGDDITSGRLAGENFGYVIQNIAMIDSFAI
jgi:hypothetical protein